MGATKQKSKARTSKGSIRKRTVSDTLKRKKALLLQRRRKVKSDKKTISLKTKKLRQAEAEIVEIKDKLDQNISQHENNILNFFQVGDGENIDWE